jgi:hypothetical protein
MKACNSTRTHQRKKEKKIIHQLCKERTLCRLLLFVQSSLCVVRRPTFEEGPASVAHRNVALHRVCERPSICCCSMRATVFLCTSSCLL